MMNLCLLLLYRNMYQDGLLSGQVRIELVCCLENLVKVHVMHYNCVLSKQHPSGSFGSKKSIHYFVFTVMYSGLKYIDCLVSQPHVTN